MTRSGTRPHFALPFRYAMLYAMLCYVAIFSYCQGNKALEIADLFFASFYFLSDVV